MKYLLLFLIISNSIYSQNKTIVPKSGTIVFVKEENILDKDLYLKSFKELKPKMIKAMEQQVVIERLVEGKKTDSIQLKSVMSYMEQSFDMMITLLTEKEKQVFKFHHEFKGDTITQYNTMDGKLINSKNTIYATLGIVTNESNEYVEIEENEIIELTEFKNQTKIIEGFKCFKVVYMYNEVSESEFDFSSNIISNKRELWVTEDVKCKFHPVIKEKEILEKYYPLEILEYSDEIKGFETIYKLELLTIN